MSVIDSVTIQVTKMATGSGYALSVNTEGREAYGEGGVFPDTLSAGLEASQQLGKALLLMEEIDG